MDSGVVLLLLLLVIISLPLVVSKDNDVSVSFAPHASDGCALSVSKNNTWVRAPVTIFTALIAKHTPLIREQRVSESRWIVNLVLIIMDASPLPPAAECSSYDFVVVALLSPSELLSLLER